MEILIGKETIEFLSRTIAYFTD